MKRFASIVLVLALCLAFCACGTSSPAKEEPKSDNTQTATTSQQPIAEPIVLRIAENQTADSHLAMCMLRFEKLVEEKSAGTIDIEVYLNGELGDEEETIEQVDAGVIDMARVDGTVLVPYVPELEVFTLPYIFENDEHKWSTFDGQIGQQINDALADKGFINLGYLESGWRSFYSSKDITSLADLAGLKIRVQNSQVYIKMMDLFKANATPMAFSEVFTSLQTGVIDAAENDPVSFVTNGHYEVAKHFLKDEHSADINLFVMSKKIFDTLSAEQQQILIDSAKEAIAWEKEYAYGLQDEAQKTAEAAGVSFVDADKAEFQAAVEPIYDMYPQYSDLITAIKNHQ